MKGTWVAAAAIAAAIPWTWAIAEVFKIHRGLIGPVESVLHQMPYGMGSGWSTWQEALSSEPRGLRYWIWKRRRNFSRRS